MDAEAVAELPPNMVARRKADTSALQQVIRNSIHNQALQAISPTSKWSPRAGRNAHYVQFEEYLRRVARVMGIKYDGIGHTPARWRRELWMSSWSMWVVGLGVGWAPSLLERAAAAVEVDRGRLGGACVCASCRRVLGTAAAVALRVLGSCETVALASCGVLGARDVRGARGVRGVPGCALCRVPF